MDSLWSQWFPSVPISHHGLSNLKKKKTLPAYTSACILEENTQIFPLEWYPESLSLIADQKLGHYKAYLTCCLYHSYLICLSKTVMVIEARLNHSDWQWNTLWLVTWTQVFPALVCLKVAFLFVCPGETHWFPDLSRLKTIWEKTLG